MKPGKVAVIGGGAWGTTLAILANENGHETRLWIREPEICKNIEETRENHIFLPGFPLAPTIQVTNSLKQAVEGAQFVIVAVPAKYFRATAKELKPLVQKETLFCSVTKGLEESTSKRASEIFMEELGPSTQVRLAVLSGPNLAVEIAKGLPAATVVASTAPETARAFQKLLMMERFRIYTSFDVAGVEFGGILKNVIAIAAGIVAGLGLGDNSKAALITRGLAEMTRFGKAHGAHPETFYGLSGLGDLLCTCASPLSRNHRVGAALAQGKTLDQILSEMHEVAEGVSTSKIVTQMAKKRNIDMPIAEQIAVVLFQKKDPRKAIQELMQREAKPE